MWRWSDIRILLVLSDLVLIQDMIYQALHAAAERIAVAIPVAQIAGAAGPVAMPLDQEADAQQEGALLDDLDDLAGVAQGRRRRDPPDRTARTLQRRRLQHALVLIAQSAQAALPRELRRVVQLVDVGHATREESVF